MAKNKKKRKNKKKVKKKTLKRKKSKRIFKRKARRRKTIAKSKESTEKIYKIKSDWVKSALVNKSMYEKKI